MAEYGRYHVVMIRHVPSKTIIEKERLRGFGNYIGYIYQVCQSICEVCNPDDYELYLFPCPTYFKDGREHVKQSCLRSKDIRMLSEAANKVVSKTRN